MTIEQKTQLWFQFLEENNYLSDFMQDILNPHIPIANSELRQKYKRITIENYYEATAESFGYHTIPCDSLIDWAVSNVNWEDRWDEWFKYLSYYE